VDVLPWVFSSGRASGINSYAVVLLLGQVADKIPYLDSVWHLVHTVIQPTVGAGVGALLAGLVLVALPWRRVRNGLRHRRARRAARLAQP
jgi:hypothetical protein